MIYPANRVHVWRLKSKISVNYLWAFPSKVACFSENETRMWHVRHRPTPGAGLGFRVRSLGFRV